MENEVRQRKSIHFLEDLRRNYAEMEFEECFGTVSVEKEMGKKMNNHKNSREKLEKVLKTVFET